jgi:hypothetical protein
MIKKVHSSFLNEGLIVTAQLMDPYKNLSVFAFLDKGLSPILSPTLPIDEMSKLLDLAATGNVEDPNLINKNQVAQPEDGSSSPEFIDKDQATQPGDDSSSPEFIDKNQVAQPEDGSSSPQFVDGLANQIAEELSQPVTDSSSYVLNFQTITGKEPIPFFIASTSNIAEGFDLAERLPPLNLYTLTAVPTQPVVAAFEYTLGDDDRDTRGSDDGDTKTSVLNITIDLSQPPVITSYGYAGYTAIDHFNNFYPIGDPLTTLSRAQQLPTSIINSFQVPPIVMAETHNVQVTFESEGAGYKNTLGWYIVDPVTKVITSVGIIWANASADGSGGSLHTGDTVSLGNLAEGTRIGFFLIANGYNTNNWTNPSNANYIDLNQGHLEFRDDSGNPGSLDSDEPLHLWYVPNDPNASAFELESVTGDERGIYLTDANNNHPDLQTDGLNHAIGVVVQSEGIIKIGFEDFYQGGNQNYRDIVFTVNLGQQTTSSIAPYTGLVQFILSDVDSTHLSHADVHISGGEQAGDYLHFLGFTLSPGTETGWQHIDGTNIEFFGQDTNQLLFRGVDTLENYQTVLSSFRLQSTASTPVSGTRDITMTVTDDTNQTSNPYVFPVIVTEAVTQGTSGDDALTAYNTLNSYLMGLEGNDQLLGQGGDDVLEGGVGNDFLDGGPGRNILLGGAGNDTLVYSPSNVFMDGGAGFDTLQINLSNTQVDLRNLQPVTIINIEKIDIGSSSDINLFLSRNGIVQITSSNVLYVDGSSTTSNTVHIDASWSNAGTSGGYTHYVNNGAHLFIDPDLHVQID